MSNHTPGPWITNGLEITTGDDLLVASIEPVDAVEVCDANARLIASAPMMDKALRFVMRGERCYHNDLTFRCNGSGVSQGDYWIDTDGQPMPLCPECAEEES